jgi:flagellar protein FliL
VEKKQIRTLLLVVAVLIVLLVGAFPLVVAIFSRYLAQERAEAQFRAVENIALEEPPPPTVSYKFAEDFRIKTADLGEPHFVRARISLGYDPGELALTAELANRNFQMRQIINLILTGKKKAELENTEQRLLLREEIKASLNHVLSDGQIREVYFVEFTVN